MSQEETNPEEVNKNIYCVIHKGIQQDEVMKTYAQWAKTWDKDVESVGYNPPKIGADGLSELYPESERGDLKILDCAAGTGLVGQELNRLGFRQMDALDACQEMLDVAKEKAIYSKLICDFMGPNRLNIETNAYDAVVSVGCFCEGHVKDDCFEELVRVVKPGGYIVIAMREKFLYIVDHFKDRLEPTMQRHHDNGLWKWVSRKVVPDYHDNDAGVLYVFQVL